LAFLLYTHDTSLSELAFDISGIGGKDGELSHGSCWGVSFLLFACVSMEAFPHISYSASLEIKAFFSFFSIH
jgi:hypothetical protein